MNLWVWRSSVDFWLWFSLQGFCILYFILSEFLTKDVLKCIVNPTYLIGCCDSTLINLVLKTFLLMFNTTHKMGCCEYCYWLGWYNIQRVKSGSLSYPFLSRIAVHGRYYIISHFFPRKISTFNKWFSHSNKRWLSERFSLLSKYELLLLEHFLFCFNAFIFL